MTAVADTITRAIEMACAPLVARIAALEHGRAPETSDLAARVKALEQRPGLDTFYKGIWSASSTYQKGTACTFDGSLWIAKSDSIAMRPGDTNGAWQLCVKRGSDGRKDPR